MRLNMYDSQQALSFLTHQASRIEAEVYRIKYPEIQYQNLIPIDNTGGEWVKSITFFSMDKVGAADWFHHLATNMPVADVNKAKFEQGMEMAGIGYRYSLEELGFASSIPGMNLTSERAEAARRASEEFLDVLAWTGNTAKGWEGFLNNSVVTRVDAATTGTGVSDPLKRLWANKTADQIIADVNDALTGIYTGTSTVEMADTILLPPAALILLSTTRIANTEANALSYLMKYNVYTLQTGITLTIRGVLGLESAGSGGVGRMVAYKRDPSVVKMHIPMPHKFLPIWQTGPMVFDIPGIFRCGPVEIRRPSAVRYVDGITAA